MLPLLCVLTVLTFFRRDVLAAATRKPAARRRTRRSVFSQFRRLYRKRTGVSSVRRRKNEKNEKNEKNGKSPKTPTPPFAALAPRRDAGIIDGKRRTFGKKRRVATSRREKNKRKTVYPTKSVPERRVSVPKAFKSDILKKSSQNAFFQTKTFKSNLASRKRRSR